MHRLLIFFFWLAILLAPGCGTTQPKTPKLKKQAPAKVTPPTISSPTIGPPSVDKEYIEKTFVLTPLRPEHTPLDYRAVMDNRVYLRTVMGWGDWPPDSMTIEEDRGALVNHFKEFKAQEAYAFAVFSTDRKKVTGCVYLYPINNKPSSVQILFWVTKDQLANDLDKAVLAKILSLLPRWGFNHAVHPVQNSNKRGSEVAVESGMTLNTSEGSSEDSAQKLFEWGATKK